MPKLRIGIDFDNTLASYDHLFLRLATELALLPAGPYGSKRSVRDALRAAGGESQWTRLQANVYGPLMAEAALIDGAGEFLEQCRRRDADVFVVSHKTRYAAADSGGVDLHVAALAWMEAQGFFADDSLGIPRAAIFFEPTREAKCQRIRTLGCTHFIDDLEEVFLDLHFPTGVESLLLYRDDPPHPRGPFNVYPNWHAIGDAIFPKS